MGNVEILKRRREFLPEIIEAALGATKSAAALGDRLLALTRLGNDAPRALELNRFLRDLTEMVERTVGESIAVEFDLGPDLRPGLIDPGPLPLARPQPPPKARGGRGAGGRLSLRTAVAPSNRVLREVAETGRGMPKGTRG